MLLLPGWQAVLGTKEKSRTAPHVAKTARTSPVVLQAVYAVVWAAGEAERREDARRPACVQRHRAGRGGGART